MPKTLSPTPYVPSGAGSTAGAVSGPSFTTVTSASIFGCVSPSASPVTVSALSHYSSSTAGLLDELQICSLDSPGASPTPSPTLSHVSTYTSTAGPDDVLTTSVASTAAAATVTNVIIPTSHCCNTIITKNKWSPPSPNSFGWLNQTFTKCVITADFLPFTNHQLQPTSQIEHLIQPTMFPYYVNVSVLIRTLSVFVFVSFCYAFSFAIQCNHTVS